MTNLSDFLKVKKVWCVDDTDSRLTKNKEYQLVGATNKSCLINCDDGYDTWARIERFEPVLDPAENPLQKMELTPEFEAVEPTFKAGDKVYCRIHEPKIFTILGVESDNTAHFGEIGEYGYEWWGFKNLCHATPENYERLQATFPHIKFEQPAKELKGSDLCRAMLGKGWKYVPCFVGNESDDFAQKTKLTDLIFALDGDRNKEFVGDDVWRFAVPFDPKTGEPLTESILND